MKKALLYHLNLHKFDYISFLHFEAYVHTLKRLLNEHIYKTKNIFENHALLETKSSAPNVGYNADKYKAQ